jgi:transposase
VKPVITAYQWHRLICQACGAATGAAWPAGVPTGACGPRVQAITALCPGAYHLSKRTTQRVMEDLFGLPMRLGTMANLEQATALALTAPVAEARAYVQAQPVAYLDDTGWREGQQRAWLWTAVTAWVTVFMVRRSRRAQVAQELLGARFWGWWVTDRWSAYTWDPAWRRQLCWAHLLRDIEAMIARGGRSRESGEALRTQARQMFHWWHRVQDGTLAHASVASYMRPIRREVERLRAAGQTYGIPKTEGSCREILKLRQTVWTFVRHAEGKPTNNAAERAIRPGVLWRKGICGTHSPEGSRFVETMMTVVATLRQQHRDVLDYLTAACEMALRGEQAPSLLLIPDQPQECMRSAA